MFSEQIESKLLSAHALVGFPTNSCRLLREVNHLNTFPRRRLPMLRIKLSYSSEYSGVSPMTDFSISGTI